MKSHKNSMRRKLFDAMKIKPLSISEVMEITGKERKASQTIIHAMIYNGYEIEIDSGWHSTTYSLKEGAKPHLLFYEVVYEKMALDIPREYWELSELSEIFSKSKQSIKRAILNIRRNICEVECEVVRNPYRGSISKYRLLDGD